MRLRWVAVAVVGFVGCESLRPPGPGGPGAGQTVQTPSPASATSPPHGGGEVGVAGHLVKLNERAGATPLPHRVGERSEQPASRGAPGEGAASLTPVSAEWPSALTTADADPLTLAAESLERGDPAAAAVHLEAYVRLRPEQLMFRAQLAELLVRVGRDDAARAHFERFAADAQAATGAPRDYLVNAHTRLMEIGRRAGDRFAEEFHRGVGLLLLVKAQDGSPDWDAEFCEEMLCKALRALAGAKELNPSDPRVRVYLAEVYDRCGNRRAAAAERAAARGSFVPGGLTPSERTRVALPD